MLNFTKKGLICDHNVLKLPWFKKNTMVPVTYLINDKLLRIFLGMCDAENIGRIGYIDVNPDNPKEILNYSKIPSLDIGERGCFDDSGVLPACVLWENEQLYMFYSAYQKQTKIPYTILTGLAVSSDGGITFKRISNIPFLRAREQELFIRSAIYCLKINNIYKIWYSSGTKFINNSVKLAPKYNLRYLECNNFFDIYNFIIPSYISVDLKAKDEYGLTTPKIFIENNIYKMIYSIRSISKGYRIGFAESLDEGKTWKRKDNNINLNVSSTGWDSEMVCFGHLQQIKDKNYLFYCGNHYGMGGMGYAELIK